MGDLKELIEKELANDKVYEFLKLKELTSKLFTKSLMEIIKPEVPYLSSDFEKLHCDEMNEKEFLSKPSVMRQFLKDQKHYLNVSHIGRTITFDYLGFVKLKMILLLRKEGVKPSLIGDLARRSNVNVSVLYEDDSIEDADYVKKQAFRNQFIDALIKQSLESGSVQSENGEFIFTNMFESNKENLLLESETQQKQRAMIHDIQKKYHALRQASTIEDMELLRNEMQDIYDETESEIMEVEDYILRADEFIENKQLLIVEKELQKIDESKVNYDSSEEVQVIQERFNELEIKYPLHKDKISLAKIKWNRSVENHNSNREIVDFEVKVVDVLSDIAQNKYSKKEALAKIEELETEIIKFPRINVSVKMAIISTKKDLETGFFKRLFG